MNSLPIHPAIVHVPIGLAVVAPFVALWGLVVFLRGRPARQIWSLAAFLQVLVTIGGVAALRTGEAEEERVEDVVPELAIETHEARAERFVWTAGGAALTAVAAAAAPAGPLAPVTAVAATLASGVTAAGALWVGHSGGELVYRHGAAQVYASLTDRGTAREHDDD